MILKLTKLNKEALLKYYIFFFILITVFVLLTNLRHEGDVLWLYDNVKIVRECIEAGRFVNCEIVHFPIFQFIPSLLFDYLGFSGTTNIKFLELINLVSFVGLIFIVDHYLKLNFNTHFRYIAILTTITGPLPWYGKSSFNEMTAAFLTTALVIAVLSNSQIWIVTFLSFLTAITKETAFPFVIALGVVCMLEKYKNQNNQQYKVTDFFQKTKSLFYLIIGTALGVLVNVGFNYFRYGEFYNIGLLREDFMVQSLTQKIIFFLGIWFSPNGGLFFFWSSLSIPLFITLIFFYRSSKNLLTSIQMLIISSITIGLTVGFSTWFAPLGWVAWGPRLMIPWIPSIFVITMIICKQEFEKFLTIFLNKYWKRLLLTIGLFMVSLPNNTVLLNHPYMFSNFFHCPESNLLQGTIEHHYECINHLMWNKFTFFSDTYSLFLSEIDTFVYGFLYLWVIYSLIELTFLLLSKSKHVQ